MRPARGQLSRLREWIVSYSDWRVRQIIFHFPPSSVFGAVTLLSAGTGQTPCWQVVCRTSPHAPGTRPLAGEAVGGGQRAASQAPTSLISATRAARQAHTSCLACRPPQGSVVGPRPHAGMVPPPGVCTGCKVSALQSPCQSRPLTSSTRQAAYRDVHAPAPRQSRRAHAGPQRRP
jgi:hypothetical protein